MSGTYGYASCDTCDTVVHLSQLNEITLPPTYADGSDGPPVRAFTCDECEELPTFTGPTS